MKKLLLFISLFFLTFGNIFAHPLDISNSTYYFKWEKLDVTTYFHTYEIEYLLKKNGLVIKNIPEYYDHRDIVEKYVKNHISLKNGQKVCSIESFDMPIRDEYSVITDGVEVNFQFVCPEVIKTGTLQVEYFLEFPLQTNKSTFFDGNSSQSTPFHYTVLTPKIFSYAFDLENKTPLCIVDTDGDGLSDTEELLYKTDVKNIDTDGDNFTDYEEVFWWWYPISMDQGPWQEYRESLPQELRESAKNKQKTASDCQNQEEEFIKNTKNTGLLQEGFANDYFKEVIQKIATYMSGTWEYSLIYIFLVVMWLWFVHAAWPGHSKTLLVSYIIDKNKSFLDGLIFITIFTLTHLIDIVVMFLVVKIFLSHYDISSYMVTIQRISIVLLIIFSGYLFFRAYKKFSLKEEKVSENLKGHILLGILSWVVPCTFGWSIFLLLFSLGKIDLILPMIVSLWIGIFLFLLLVLTLTYFLRKKFFDGIEIFSRFSSLISSWLLFFIGLYLLSLLY